MKKILMLATMATAAFFGSPDNAHACNRGHYEYRTQTVKQWVPPKNVRYQVREWIPGRIYDVNQTQVIRSGHWAYDNCGRKTWSPPLTRYVRIQKQTPGSYRIVWKTKCIPGYYKTVHQPLKVYVSDCRCNLRPNTQHFRSRPVVTINGRRLAAQGNRNGATLSRQIKRSGRQVNRQGKRNGSTLSRQGKRTGRQLSKEAKRTGSRIGKELKRIFK